MISQNVELIDCYSCQSCHKDFRSEKERQVIVSMSPVCSYSCKLSVIIRILKSCQFSDFDLEFMQKTIENKPIIPPFDKNYAYFVISKYYSKWDLSLLIDKSLIKQGQRHQETRQETSKQRQETETSPVYVIDRMSLSVPNSHLSNKKRGLSLWL